MFYENKKLLLDEVILFENFTNRIDEIFVEHNLPQKIKICNLRAYRNSTQHSNYRSYYTPQLKDLVYNKDKEIIQRYHYEF